MSRKSNVMAFRERTRLEDVLADIKEYVLVETGAISEMEACDRIDDWKTEHWGGR